MVLRSAKEKEQPSLSAHGMSSHHDVTSKANLPADASTSSSLSASISIPVTLDELHPSNNPAGVALAFPPATHTPSPVANAHFYARSSRHSRVRRFRKHCCSLTFSSGLLVLLRLQAGQRPSIAGASTTTPYNRILTTKKPSPTIRHTSWLRSCSLVCTTTALWHDGLVCGIVSGVGVRIG